MTMTANMKLKIVSTAAEAARCAVSYAFGQKWGGLVYQAIQNGQIYVTVEDFEEKSRLLNAALEECKSEKAQLERKLEEKRYGVLCK